MYFALTINLIRGWYNVSSPQSNSNPILATREVTDERARSSADADRDEELSYGLLDAVLQVTPADPSQGPLPLEMFLDASSHTEALSIWTEATGLAPDRTTLRQAARLINGDIARLDAMLDRQVNAILHHPRFQKLEASWRGLKYLVDQIEDGSHTQVRVLDVSWKTLVRDLDRAIEFDQSQLFKKVYTEEFGTAGGEPYSVLLGDYDIRPRPRPGNPMSDLDALRSISQVAAAAFAPFVASAHPSLFGLDSFTELQRPLDLAAIYEQPEFTKWRSLRQIEDSRFIALTLPKILMRLPHDDSGSRADGFRFTEDVSSGGNSSYLWGNAAYAFGAVLIRAFAQSGWLADIRGVRQGVEEGGLVTDLPVHTFGTDPRHVAMKSSTDVTITDVQENDLSELGFIPLCHCKGTEHAAFYSNASIQKPQIYDDPYATANAKISTYLQYMLCVGRLAHYVKVIGREKVGSFMEASDCESFLNNWLQRYVTQDEDAPPEFQAQYPLREAQVELREQPGKPGCYYCVVRLQPHYQLDNMSSAVTLTTELTPPAG